MSWAPRLISLSSSGNRYDSVSRESSVHSMMSMNCFLMKSRIAIFCPLCAANELRDLARDGLWLGRCRRHLLRRGLGGLHLRLQAVERQRTRHHRPVGEDQRRRGADAVLLAKLGDV